jgi:hypothetical protein
MQVQVYGVADAVSRDLIRRSVGEDHFLMAGEAPYGAETLLCSE